jgi:uncharacterized membrane protein YjjP (DUF1212 family)
VTSDWQRHLRPPRHWSPPAVGGSGSADRDAERFLLRLARALHVYGTPAHRLEEALVTLAEFFGLEAQFLVSPTSISISFGHVEDQRTHLIRVDAGENDLSKLAALHEILRDVVEGQLDAAAARQRVLEVTASPPRYPGWVAVLGFALSSASVACIFGGGGAEVWASTAVGLVVGAVVVAGGRHPRLRLLGLAISGWLAGFCAFGLAARTELYAPVVVLSSLIVLLPGLSMTVAMNELACGHVVSGTSRLTSTLVILLQLGFGVALGTRMASLSAQAPLATHPTPLPGWTVPLAVVPMAISLVILFQARWKDLVLILPAMFLSYLGTRLGVQVLGPELGAAVGALGLGIGSNAMARWRDVPTAIPLVPGLLPLVPGSLGMRSLQSILSSDVLHGVQNATDVALIAVGLVSGLLVANLVVTPRRLL